MLLKPEKAVFNDHGLTMFSTTNKMIDGVVVKRCKVFPDERGRLGEIVRRDDVIFEKFGQVYFTTIFPGVVKAWHMHKKQTDYMYVVQGNVKVVLFESGVINEITIGVHAPGLIKIPPMVQHGVMNVGMDLAILFDMTTRVYNYKHPDIVRSGPHDYSIIPYKWPVVDK